VLYISSSRQSLLALTPYSSFLLLPYHELLFKPLGNGHLVDMEEQVPLAIHYHLCRDIIGKRIAPVFV